MLCVAHHTAIHEGRLLVEGRPSRGLRFTHADGTPYGGPVSPEVAALRAAAFQALRGLGFREREARRVVDRANEPIGPADQRPPMPVVEMP